jgi:photosystem II stability/assembly factor-like uncharacterized protein
MLKTLLTSIMCLATLHAGAQATGHSGPWELQHSGSIAGLRGIHAVGGGVVWASGTGGTVLRSEDSGDHWQQCTTPPDAAKLDFRGIWAWDAQTVLLLSSGPGDQSRLYRTTNSCASWTLLLTNPDATTSSQFPGFWDGILFLDRQHGLIYGDPVLGTARTHSVATGHLALGLYESHDGGNTWGPAQDLKLLPEESLFAASNSTMTAKDGWLWLGTSKARVLRTRTGMGWESAQTPLASGNVSSGVFSLAFRDQKHGIAVGGDYRRPNEATGNAATTSDSGIHWRAARKPPHGYRSAVAWDATNEAWIAVGSNGSDISYDDGRTWQWLDSGNWNALSLPWAVGTQGRIGKLGTIRASREAATPVSR